MSYLAFLFCFSLYIQCKTSFLGTPVLKIDKCFLTLSLCSIQIHLSCFVLTWQSNKILKIQSCTNQSIHPMWRKKHVCLLRNHHLPGICFHFCGFSWTSTLASSKQKRNLKVKDQLFAEYLPLINVKVPLLPTSHPIPQLCWNLGRSRLVIIIQMSLVSLGHKNHNRNNPNSVSHETDGSDVGEIARITGKHWQIRGLQG